MFGRKKLDFAILFRKMEVNGLDFPIFFPDGILIGRKSVDETTFTDYLTGRKHLNVNISTLYGLDYGFKLPSKMKDLKAFMGTRNKKDALRGYFEDMERQVYFYDVNHIFVAMSITEFEKAFEVKLPIWNTVYDREIIDEIINDDISVDDFMIKYSGIDGKDTVATDKIQSILNRPISEIVSKIKETIIAQDDTITELVTAIYKHLSSDDPNMKANILLCGPSGSGKTAIIEELAKIIDIPVLIEDMTRYTASGYVGSSAIDILTDLYVNSGSNIKLAERSILFLDEIDKKSQKGRGDYDFNKKDVLNDLLKIIEGGTFYIETLDKKMIPFDTSRLIVIVGGAFSSLFEHPKTKKIIEGFNPTSHDNTDLENDVTITDLRRYGMSPEFLGRIKYIIKMNKLSVKDLITIMKEGKKSPIKSYLKFFKNLGVNVVIDEDFYERIARLAYNLRTGARGLNLIINKIFNNILYDIFNTPGEGYYLILGDNIVEDSNDYELIHVLRRKSDNSGR